MTVESVFQDVRFAWRSLRRTPGAVLLAAGLGLAGWAMIATWQRIP